MGVYIKGMKMPESCMLCHFCMEEADPANGEMCLATGSLMPPCTRVRLDDCPLVEIPPHGDLIDRDALKTKQQQDADLFLNVYSLGDVVRRDEALNAVANILNAPTVIEAEEES